MIDLETWLILAERCETISRLQDEKEEPDAITLSFDEHDQASIVRRE